MIQILVQLIQMWNWFDLYGATLPADSDDHGTHVMGTAVGQDPDGINKIGVAPGAKWIAARVFDMWGYTTDAILLMRQSGCYILVEIRQCPDVVEQLMGWIRWNR